MKILVDSLPTDTEPCLFSECQRSGNRTCWFCDYVFVCDPVNCKFITNAGEKTHSFNRVDDASVCRKSGNYETN